VAAVPHKVRVSEAHQYDVYWCVAGVWSYDLPRRSSKAIFQGNGRWFGFGLSFSATAVFWVGISWGDEFVTSLVESWQVGQKAVYSEGGMVAAQHRLAAQAGGHMLAHGGNAIDAAVATAFALGALEPWMCGMGGSGYAVVHRADGNAEMFDFQGVLPAAIAPDDYPLAPGHTRSLMGFPGVVDNRNVVGFGAISVPGAVAGLAALQSAHGKLALDTVMRPAIDLATGGLAVNWFSTLNVSLAAADLLADPGARAMYLPGGVPAQPETRLDLSRLAATLKAVADNGPDTFYRGSLAARLVADLRSGGSVIDEDDLAAYEVLRSAPLRSQHRGHDILTAGETSGGPRLIEALAHMATCIPVGASLDTCGYVALADALDGAFASHSVRTGVSLADDTCTSHLSAVDAEGNMVALTYTLLNRFGARVVLPDTGLTMNNAVSYFDPRPGFPTSMAGGKRINSSNMCPTIAVKDGEAVFAVGASGANHIVPCTFQLASFLLDFGMDLEGAFHTPRIDASNRGSVRVDPRLPEDTIQALVAAGNGSTRRLERAQLMVFPKLYSCPSGVTRNPQSGQCAGAADPSSPVSGASGPVTFSVSVAEENLTDVRA
jgi:gamma-glutamyltranspeptidase/glutathione hydrolase